MDQANKESRSGIYIIVNMVTGDQYIGSSVHIDQRLVQHRSLLHRGYHHNQQLQEDWNTFGASSFQFDILEQVPNHSQLGGIEQRYLDERHPTYNRVHVALRTSDVEDSYDLEQDVPRDERNLAALSYYVRLVEQFSRGDDLSRILLAFQALTPEGMLQVYNHRALAATVYRRGVESGTDFLAFLNEGYQGLYDGETAENIRIRKGLPPRADILDWMGSLESAANAMRGALALHHMEHRGVATLVEANRTHRKAGEDVRGFLVSQGVYPEKLPTPTKSYQQLLREQALRERLAAEDRTGLWSLLPADETEGNEDD